MVRSNNTDHNFVIRFFKWKINSFANLVKNILMAYQTTQYVSPYRKDKYNWLMHFAAIVVIITKLMIAKLVM